MILFAAASEKAYYGHKFAASIGTTTAKFIPKNSCFSHSIFRYLDPVFPLLRVKGARTIGIIYADRTFQTDTKRGTEKNLKYHDLEVICEAAVPFSFDPPTTEQYPETYQAVLNMIECNPDVLIALVSQVFKRLLFFGFKYGLF